MIKQIEVSQLAGSRQSNQEVSVSIIIVNWNGKNFLGPCLDSIRGLHYPQSMIEVIVVDNYSNDGSIGFLKEEYPWVRLITLEQNYGFCYPNNLAANIAKGDYLVLLNNDTIVTPEWLSELVAAVNEDERVVCCASKMLYNDRRNVINTAGGKLTIIGAGFYIGYGDFDGPKYSIRGLTGFGCGAGVLVQRRVFMRLGGFEDGYFASCEEHDLGMKLWLTGYKVTYVPTAIMYHAESGTFGVRGSIDPFKMYYITRNRLFNIVKNFELTNVFKGVLISVAFDCYRSFRYIILRKPEMIISVIKGYMDFVRGIKPFVRKRWSLQSDRTIPDSELSRLGVLASLRESIAEELRERRLVNVL